MIEKQKEYIEFDRTIEKIFTKLVPSNQLTIKISFSSCDPELMTSALSIKLYDKNIKQFFLDFLRNYHQKLKLEAKDEAREFIEKT